MASTTGKATTAAEKAAAAWNGLNGRQRAYLQCLYKLDQDAETLERGAFAAGGRARPAAQWRWIPYGYVNVGQGAPRGAMQRALDARDRRDQGAGSTLAVLADRGLIEHRHDELSAAALQARWCRGDTYHVSVKLTRAGRAAARASGVDDTRPGRAPRGLLSEWLWTVLIQVRRAGDDGVPEDRRYTAWRYLEEHTSGALVQAQHGRGLGNAIYVISDLGREHYRQHWATYARLYPQIAAPHPDGEVQWPAAIDAHLRDLGSAARTISAHLAAVLAEQQELTTTPNPPGPAPSAPVGDTPDLGHAHQLAAARDTLAAAYAEQRLALLNEHVPALRQLYRTAAARYAAAAVAVTQAATSGTDPRAALSADPLGLDEAGRPVDLPRPVTDLTGLDEDIATRHQTAVSGPPPFRPPRSRRRVTAPKPPADGPAQDLTAYADHLAALVKGGQLTRLRLRV